ncbi:methyltransferase domain-containing protein [Flaviflexus equikiangi]|uniref:methyltransferase domain-containing protein n=1 Tax=Flaviflexus equikiangi TaxID=2758573 RepID=UPI0015F5B856|nr:methyltransferase domain-containing protein [Flaviflexus equikiangi]
MATDNHFPLTPCGYFNAGLCRSCTHLAVPYREQVALKQRRAEETLPCDEWFAPVESAEFGFRNKAKIVVTGTPEHPRLGIVGDGRGQDLRDCLLYPPIITAAHETLARFIARAGLVPYSIPDRMGELKSIILTASPIDRLMIRFVLRTEELVPSLLAHLDWLVDRLPVDVVTANIHPHHVALPEGPTEIPLYGDDVLDMSLGPLDLRLRPQGFFQTNTDITRVLYATAAAWVDETDPEEVWDLYCGVGGFAKSVARPWRTVRGVELSEDAVRAAGGPPTFIAADAGLWARQQDSAPDLLIVNPPRRGIGDLAEWIRDSPIDRVLYSSCNLRSAADDLGTMGFRAVRAQLFDMFPHTGHMECLILAERSTGSDG